MYNLKTWVSAYLNGLQNRLNARQDNHNHIMQIDDAEERKDRLKMLHDSDSNDRVSFEAERNFNFIKARIGLMPDLISGHMSEYAPGSLKCQKYSESRQIFNQIESKVAELINSEKNCTVKLAKLNEIIALANTLDEQYCWAYELDGR